jgi:hypothetical protein
MLKMDLKNHIPYTLTLLLFSNYAISQINDLKADKNIQVEYLTKRVVQNNADKDTSSNWDQESAHLLQGNIGFDLDLWGHKFSGNGFFRLAESPLFNKDPQAASYSQFPESAVGRDLFKIFHSKTDGNRTQYGAINQFEYEWSDDELTFKAGRMFINYGEGMFFNPINPFNFVSSLSNSIGTNSGNDGIQFKIHREDQLKLYIYILGDKSFTDYDKKITRTAIVRGDWNINKDTNLNYILGEDQKRHKYGLEILRRYKNNKIFAQLVRFSQRLDNENPDDEGIAHSLLGIETVASDKWTIRIEIGSAENPDSEEKLDSRYLPFEKIFAMQNNYMFTEELSLKLGVVADHSSQSSLYKSELIYSPTKSLSTKFFASGPMSTPNSKDDNIATLRKIPYEIGLAMQAQF